MSKMSKSDHDKAEDAPDRADSLPREQREALERRRQFVRKALVSAGLLAGAGVINGMLARSADAGTTPPPTTPPPISVDEPSTWMLVAGGAAAAGIANRIHSAKSRRHDDERGDKDED